MNINPSYAFYHKTKQGVKMRLAASRRHLYRLEPLHYRKIGMFYEETDHTVSVMSSVA